MYGCNFFYREEGRKREIGTRKEKTEERMKNRLRNKMMLVKSHFLPAFSFSSSFVFFFFTHLVTKLCHLSFSPSSNFFPHTSSFTHSLSLNIFSHLLNILSISSSSFSQLPFFLYSRLFVFAFAPLIHFREDDIRLNERK